MNSYKYFCIDATYYLRRNWCAIKNSNPNLNEYQIIDSFLFTLLKLYKVYPADKILLLFDRKPYKKQQVIKEYKSNRRLVLNEKAELLDKLNKAKTEEEKNEINKQLDSIKLDSIQLETLFSAENILIENFRGMGLVPIKIKGYEADDLARLISLIAKNKNDKVVLVTGDSDWICMTNTNTDVVRTCRGSDEFYTYEKKDCKLDDFHMYQINDIYYGGHNNVLLSEEYKNYPIEDIIDSIINNDDRFTEFKQYYNALDIDRYLNEIKGTLLNYMTNIGSYNQTDWYDFRSEHSDDMRIAPYYFSNNMRKLDLNLYKDAIGVS